MCIFVLLPYIFCQCIYWLFFLIFLLSFFYCFASSDLGLMLFILASCVLLWGLNIFHVSRAPFRDTFFNMPVLLLRNGRYANVTVPPVSLN